MKSEYGDRDTVGTIYLEAQKNSISGLTVRDIGEEMVTSLIEDLNTAIASDPFDGKMFYVNVVEHFDLQMKKALKRRIFKSLFRPYPEDNTLVFKVEPATNMVWYCWDLPHHSESWNILSNEHWYPPEYVEMIKDYKRNDLSRFGFVKVSMNSSQVEEYAEKEVNAYRQAWWEHLQSQGWDEKSLEAEKRWGYFWIPQKRFKDTPLDNNKPKVSILDFNGLAIA